MGGSVSTDQRLLDAMLSLANDLRLSDVLHHVVQVACELVGARYGAMAVAGPDRQVLEFSAGDEGIHFPAGDPRSITTDDLPGFLAVPVHVRGEEFGSLYLAGKAEFSQRDEEIVAAVAATAGVAIENARLFEKARQRETWLRATTEVTTAMLTGTSGRDALCLVANRARAAAGGIVATLMLLNDDDELVLEVVDGGRGVLAEGQVVPRRPDSLTYEVFDSGEARHSAEAGACLVEPPGAVGPGVLVPLSAGERMLGVLLVSRPAGEPVFDETDIELVESFAGQAALVMELTRAQSNAQRLAVLEDRDRIARDLHDLVIQRLFGLGLGLQGLTGSVERPTAAERITKFVEEVDATIREIRRTIFSLQEPPSPNISLRGQIMRAVQETAGLTGFEPALSLQGPLDSLVPDALRPDLLATLREALTNVARHALAERVQVTVVVDPSAARLGLVVRDDGVGLSDEPPHRSGGLANMAARAARWNGNCSIESVPGEGVRVFWSVPLVQEVPWRSR
ncbi:histidine kinase [Lentzea sp. NBRC 105346]|uniref:sensor histidine kinase n=1 Tax=Lentzea sp. NBRC 105346 TaxID=3032205 RepID=UPI0024A2CB3A|nr:GAF domain-containing protein [Lentzea sp. NBRC 105346]GLZ30250.1 histidine kinase [Lentzea sp. NBRC 105346]